MIKRIVIITVMGFSLIGICFAQVIEKSPDVEKEKKPDKEQPEVEEIQTKLSEPAIKPWYDESGNQIPPEWVEELRVAGVKMFTYKEAQQRRKQNYIDNAKARQEAAEKTDKTNKEEAEKEALEKQKEQNAEDASKKMNAESEAKYKKYIEENKSIKKQDRLRSTSVQDKDKSNKKDEIREDIEGKIEK